MRKANTPRRDTTRRDTTTRATVAQQWISLAQAAEQLAVHPRTIRRMIERGELEGSRVGPRLIRVRAADVEALAQPIPTVRHAAG